jgi:hypothetical protein
MVDIPAVIAGGRGLDPIKTTALKAWASFSIFPLLDTVCVVGVTRITSDPHTHSQGVITRQLLNVINYEKT